MCAFQFCQQASHAETGFPVPQTRRGRLPGLHYLKIRQWHGDEIQTNVLLASSPYSSPRPKGKLSRGQQRGCTHGKHWFCSNRWVDLQIVKPLDTSILETWVGWLLQEDLSITSDGQPLLLLIPGTTWGIIHPMPKLEIARPDSFLSPSPTCCH